MSGDEIGGAVAAIPAGRADVWRVLIPADRATEKDDGLLTAGEIAAFDLPARLVVPSACKTAAGEGGAATGFPVDAGVLSSARARSPEFRQGSCSQLTFCSLTRAPDRPRASSAAIRSAGQ